VLGHPHDRAVVVVGPLRNGLYSCVFDGSDDITSVPAAHLHRRP
jgi:hypothetical protein